jgi:putative hydrolase of the HAD superfamily
MEGSRALQLLAFDADDTLWVNEPLYTEAQDRLTKLLRQHVSDATSLTDALYQTEMRNLELFGYGAKSFTLSMIETAIKLSSGRITGGEIQEIVDIGKGLMRHPIQLLPGVEETLARLAGVYDLMLITKGDLFDQESKIARSGLADRFVYVEIVSEKDEHTYADILERRGVAPATFMMVGNSLRSDIIPALKIGAYVAHIPFHVTWQHEQVAAPDLPKDRYFQLESIHDLPDLLGREFEGDQGIRN